MFNRFVYKRLAKRRGFTLFELLIGIVISSILLGLITGSYLSIQRGVTTDVIRNRIVNSIESSAMLIENYISVAGKNLSGVPIAIELYDSTGPSSSDSILIRSSTNPFATSLCSTVLDINATQIEFSGNSSSPNPQGCHASENLPIVSSMYVQEVMYKKGEIFNNPYMFFHNVITSPTVVYGYIYDWYQNKGELFAFSGTAPTSTNPLIWNVTRSLPSTTTYRGYTNGLSTINIVDQVRFQIFDDNLTIDSWRADPSSATPLTPQRTIVGYNIYDMQIQIITEDNAVHNTWNIGQNQEDIKRIEFTFTSRDGVQQVVEKTLTFVMVSQNFGVNVGD